MNKTLVILMMLLTGLTWGAVNYMCLSFFECNRASNGRKMKTEHNYLRIL